MANPSILRIERINYILAIVATVVGLLVTRDQAIVLGLMVGSALTCLNFYVLRRLVVKWTADAASGKTGNASLLMLPKMILLMGAVAVAVLVLPLDVIAFAVGYSIFILSIIVDVTFGALRPAHDPVNSEHDHG